ncbi:MAG: hypothetical protein PHH06_02275 [Candidatus Gracilibacteria bacterium]|nr:hypothetical protein [Candidatus Gracilibacteria bacterium]
MQHQIRLDNQPHFIPEYQEALFNIENGIDVDIPGVFVFQNPQNGKKIDLYKSVNDSNYYTIDGKVFDFPAMDDVKLTQKKERVTRIDLLNFRGLDDNGIEKLIKESLGVDINTQQGIDKLNDFFLEGVRFLEEVGRKLPDKYIDNNFFADKNEVLMFCKDTTKSGRKQAYINCLISKSISVVADVITNEERMHLEERTEFIINKYIRNRKEVTMLTDNTGYLTLGKRKIYFAFSYRHKSDKSAKFKVAKDPEYFSTTKFFDDIGLTHYTSTKEESILLDNFLNCIIYGNDANYEIDNKGYFSSEIIEDNSDKLSSSYLDKLRKLERKKRQGSDSRYSESKSKGDLNVPRREHLDIPGAVGDNIGFEKKADTFDSQNEYGLSLQPVYGYFKYFDIMSRFYQGYISESEVDFVVDLFFLNLPEELRKKNKLMEVIGKEKTIDEYFDELEYDLNEKLFLVKPNQNRKAKERELKVAFKQYYLSKMLKVEVEGRVGIYLTTPREYHLSLAGYRKKMTIIRN